MGNALSAMGIIEAIPWLGPSLMVFTVSAGVPAPVNPEGDRTAVTGC